MRVTVVFDYPFGIAVELRTVLEELRPLDVARHFVLVLPSLPHLFLLRPELLDVGLDFFAEEDLLEVHECPVLEGELLVFEDFVEIRTQLCPLELVEAVDFLRLLLC